MHCEDYDTDVERLELRYRPESGTPLKNGDEGERIVALDAEVCRSIEDYINLTVMTSSTMTDASPYSPVATVE